MSKSHRGVLRGVLIPASRAVGAVQPGEARLSLHPGTKNLIVTHEDGTKIDVERIARAGSGTNHQILVWDTTSSTGATWLYWPEAATRMEREGYRILEDFELASN